MASHNHTRCRAMSIELASGIGQSPFARGYAPTNVDTPSQYTIPVSRVIGRR